MILKEYNLSVRLPQEKAIDTGISLVQNDKDVYKLNIRIFDGVNEIDYSEVDSATITFLKRDNNVVQGNMAVEADQLSYTLGTNEIACPGKVLVSIQLFGTTERLSTARFVMSVERDLVTAEAVQSTSEFPILQQLKQDLEAIDVVELTSEFNAHTAEKATDAAGVHGLKIESGTWTPNLSYNTDRTGFSYDSQLGHYLKINNICFLTAYIKLTANGTGTGALLIEGLPFATDVTGSIHLSINAMISALGITLPANTYTLRVRRNTSITLLVYAEGSNLQSNLAKTNLSDTAEIRLNMQYRVWEG